MREERLFNRNWSFLKTEYRAEEADEARLEEIRNTEGWTEVELPHDWLIYDTLDLYGDATGWYRKEFSLPLEEDMVYLINFDGVYMDSAVYVNGRLAGVNRYGYSAFEYDITGLLKDGINEIIVQVRHKSPNTRWYSGAGIFRDVTFKRVPATHFVTDGVYVSCKKANGRWVVITDVEIAGPDAAKAELDCSIRLCPSDPGSAGTISKPCPEAEEFVLKDSSHGDNCAACGHPCASRGEVRVSDVEFRDRGFTFIIDNPFEWDITAPNLYEMRVSLSIDNCETDAVTVKFGLRTVEFTTDRGFILNGRRVKLYGVCEHHDLGCLGAAFNRDAMRRKMLVLKNMGVNAVRTSHNMPARGLMELADEMGILIDSEAFDMWRRPKTEYDYARFFDDDCLKAVASWVRRDRCHPSVIMWSIGNEIYDCHADESARDLTRMLKSAVEEHDPMHNAFVTHGSNYMPWEGAQKCADILKLAGYNYGEKLYDAHHKEHPDWMIYGSETSSTVQSRGVYHFPMNVSVMADDDEQCSTLGNCTTSWGAENVEYVIKADRDRDFSAGQFLWSGFDYIGEPTPYHTKNSYFGQIDTAGFAKDTYYIFKAEWTDFKKAPFVHVFPYWDFNEGQLIDVRIATNAPEAELFVNGVSQGKKAIGHVHGKVLCPTWQVPYHKGCIEAVAYDGEGHEAARECRRSFTDAVRLSCRKFDLKDSGSDSGRFGSSEAGRLLFYEIFALDRDGNEVENAACRVNVTVKNGTLMGLDNGDSTDFEQYKCSSRRMFNGRLLAVVRVDGYEDDVEVEFTSPGIEGCSGNPDAVCGISAGTSDNTVCDIPIRKLELTCSGSRVLSPDNREVTVTASILPDNASYSELIWAAVNDYAVESNLAELEPDGGTCKVTAKGDGSFRLRCMAKNGTDKVKIISVIEFSAEGIGTAYINPYEFVAGSLYTDSKGDVGNGNEKGVATPRGEESFIGYDNIDFGDFGSDEITLPIFTLDGNEYRIGIWEGRPGEPGSELLCDGRYRKPSIWNVYQPETYRLSRRVKGVTSIYFTADAKYHIKGFTFTRPDKAVAAVRASENSRIYGDTYTEGSDAVTGIGNNVTLEFDGMNFGSRRMTHLILCGSSPIENNSIHLKVTDTVSGESRTELLEFRHSEGYEERRFDIGAVTGDTKIGFVFLPGSNFNFKYFKFEE